MAKQVDSTNIVGLLQDVFTKIKSAFWAKGDTSQLAIDNTPTSASDNLVKSGGVYSEVHPAVENSEPVGGMLPNVKYNLGTLTGTVTIGFASPTDNTIENEYKFTFDTDTTAPTITWPNSITEWQGNCLDSSTPPVPNIKASKHYEVSVEDGYAIIVEF